MLSEATNTLVLALAGLAMGVLLAYGTLHLQDVDRQRAADEANDKNMSRKILKRTLLFNAAFYGLLGVLVISLVLSPLELRWIPLIIGILLGSCSTVVIFVLAMRRKIEIRGTSIVDVAFRDAPPDAPRTTDV